jgi:cysteine peptidase B
MNQLKAKESQRRNPHATFGMSPFADMSAAEFKVRHSAEGWFAKTKEFFKAPMVTDYKFQATYNVDWRTKGAVTPIKNQGQCGSCWSFSTTGNIEGQWAIAGHPLTSLSEQELVSCDTTMYGCNGGLPSGAMQWLIQSKNGSIVTESSYPYKSGTGNTGSCQYHAAMPTGAQISGHIAIQSNEEAMAAWLVQHGPISIGVDAGNDWQNYQGGILTHCAAGQLDHAVLVVGVDTAHQPPYWIVKNSWGVSWGEQGYIRLHFGSDACGIKQDPRSAVVKA